jgi:cellulose synthase (UDP-forming)
MNLPHAIRHGRAFRGGLWARSWVAWPVMALGALIGITFIVVPLDAEQQAWLAVAGFLMFLVTNRLPGRVVTIFLVFVSSLVSLRYIHWRLVDTLEFTTFVQTFLGTGLLMAEIYAIVCMLLAYFQVIWPLDRKPVPLPDDPETWPTVDIFIPTYNEPLEVVKPAIYGALAIDWPGHKMNVFVLDDGRRDEFRRFCEQVGCNYIIRPDNKGAKAGNINHALTKTMASSSRSSTATTWRPAPSCSSPSAGCCATRTSAWSRRRTTSTRPTRSSGTWPPASASRTRGCCSTARAAGQRPVERRLLLRLLRGDPARGAAGGRRRADADRDRGLPLLAQDAAARLAHGLSPYPLAAGLATERLMLHIGQRMRWGRGMIQILRIENPMTGPGLRWFQRCCYFMSQFHFLFPLPRFVFLTAPLAFLLFGENIIAASPLAILVYAGPHIIHSVGATSRLTGHVRHSFWSEIYETVLALYLIPVMLATLLDPKKGKFNVTDKGGTLQEGFFDLRAVGPNLVLALALIAGVLAGIYGLSVNPVESLDFQAFALNMIWAVLSFIVVLAGLAVGRERRQVRERARVGAVVAANVVLPDGRVIEGETMDLSLGGAAVAAARPDGVPDEAEITLELDVGPEWVAVPAEVLRWQDGRMQVRFAAQTLQDEGNIVRAVLGRADAWVDWDEVRQDKPLRSLAEVARSIGGLFRGDSQISAFVRRQRRGPARAQRAVPGPAAGAAAPTAATPIVPAEAAPPSRRPRGEGPARRAAAALLALSLAVPGAAFAQVNLRGAPPPPSPLQPGPQGLPLQQSPGIGGVGAPQTQSQAVPLSQPGFGQGGVGQPAFAQGGVAPQIGGTVPGGAPFPGQPTIPLLTGPLGTTSANINLPPLPQAQSGFLGAMPTAPGGFGSPSGPPGSSRTETRTLRQLGLRAPMQLRGASDLQGILFGVRGDEVVTGARLVLQGATSPALIPEFSQINMALNEQFVGVINPDRNRPAFGPLEFPINPVFFADLNRLNFRFTGRYTVECNDPLSGLLWANLSDLSTLQLTLERLPLLRDLARLPEPFFDPAPAARAAEPAGGRGRRRRQRRAARRGLRASWFAVQADYRGASFPVSFQVPQRGMAVIVAAGQDSIPGIALPRFDGPTLALVPNPADPLNLLLVVGGRTGAEAAQAAVVLAGSREALAGEIAVVQPISLPPRAPYDAPRWIRTDRPVRFGELVDPRSSSPSATRRARLRSPSAPRPTCSPGAAGRCRSS